MLVLVFTVSAACYSRSYGQTDVQYPADAGVYNVKYFGATGNGTTDDTAAFQAAISAALDQSALMVGTTNWSIGASNAVLQNDVSEGSTAITLFNNGGTLETINSTGGWQSWNGSAFAPVSPTTMGGASMLYIGSTATLTIGTDVWSITSTGALLRNGVTTDTAGEAIFNNNGTPEYVSSVGKWYYWNSSNSWTEFYPSQMGTAGMLYTNHYIYTRDGAMVILYIPNGTYLLSGTLYSKDASGWLSGLYLQGQSQAATILKLKPGIFTNTSTPQAVIETGSEGSSSSTGTGEAAFRHYIRNLTVDTGTGNTGAIGIDYLVNNRGGIYNVTVQSDDYSGITGIRMDRSYPGPGILKNVTVTGFNTGISMLSQDEYGMTLENINLSHQNTDGINITENLASINGLTSNNTVPVLITTNSAAHVTLLNGTFTGGASANTAISGPGALYCRNITSSGYGTIVGTYTGGASPVVISEYESTAAYKEFTGNIPGSICLPVEPTPDFNSTTLSQWVNGATYSTVTNGDYLSSIQAAIDNSKSPVVYLPQGNYYISNTIHLRGSVQKFIGCNTKLLPMTSFPAGAPMIQFDGGSSEVVDIQNLAFSNANVVQNSDLTLAIENCDVGVYSNTSEGTGDTFLEDVESSNINIDYPQYVWARQLDIEGLSSNYITNNGGVLWLFGYKTEITSSTVSMIVGQNGSWTELMGGFFYLTGTTSPTVPMIINNNGVMSLNYLMDPNETISYATSVQDTEGGTEMNFSKHSNVVLYSAAPQTYGQATLDLSGADIGTVPIAGSNSTSGNIFTVAGSGEISSTADSFHFDYEAVTGNFDIIARVLTQGDASAPCKAGVMIRNDTSAGSPNTLLAATPGYGWTFHVRSTEGGNTISNTGGNGSCPLPFWVRLNRTGNVFTGYYSTNGTTWTQSGTNTITAMGTTVKVGIAVDSGGADALSTCTFDNVGIVPNP